MGKKLFEKISFNVLEPGPVPFDLYFPKQGNRLGLLCRAGFEVNDRHKRLVQKNGNSVYVKSSDRDELINYTRERLSHKISDQQITLRDKARMVHMFSSRSIRAIIAQPSSPEAYEDSVRAVQYLFELIREDAEAAGELFDFTENEAYSYSHSQNVAILNLLIGMKMFYGHPKKVQELALCGFWHDIGKVQVRKEIIYKRGKFSPEEREEAERHVFYSEQIMRGHDMTEEVCQSGRSHHERWDGRGYPDGVSGKMIPLYARITAVSDSYDAITSNKVYRRGSNEWHGLAEIARNMGAFDPRIFFVLLEIVLRNEDLITGFKTRFGLDAYEIGLRSEISVGDANPFHLPIGS